MRPRESTLSRILSWFIFIRPLTLFPPPLEGLFSKTHGCEHPLAWCSSMAALEIWSLKAHCAHLAEQKHPVKLRQAHLSYRCCCYLVHEWSNCCRTMDSGTLIVWCLSMIAYTIYCSVDAILGIFFLLSSCLATIHFQQTGGCQTPGRCQKMAAMVVDSLCYAIFYMNLGVKCFGFHLSLWWYCHFRALVNGDSILVLEKCGVKLLLLVSFWMFFPHAMRVQSG